MRCHRRIWWMKILDYSSFTLLYTVTYRPVVKQWLCKQRQLLGKARFIHVHNYRTTVLCNPFLSKGTVYTPKTTDVLSEMLFSLRSVQSSYKEEFSWESAVEFRSSKWAVSRELGSANKAEKMALWVELWSVNQRVTMWPRKLNNLHCVKSVARKLLVETSLTEDTSVCVSLKFEV
jgi:hypothetical protein